MEPQNQKLYDDFRQTIQQMTQHKEKLLKEIEAAENHIEQMKKELANTEHSLLLYQGGMSTLEVLTQQGLALVPYNGEEHQLALNPYQYNRQPAQQYKPPQPISEQAQQTFAPNPVPYSME